MITILTPTEELKPNPKNVRTHSKKQIRQLADAISAFGFTAPLIADGEGNLLAGHGRLEAAKLLNLTTVPVVEVSGLTAAKKRALALADNKIAANSGWDRELLAIELSELTDILIEDKLDISITGFAPVEIDQIIQDFEESASDPADEIEPALVAGASITRAGDIWQLDKHRLLCGDARSAEGINLLMGDERAAMAFLDVPYNVRVRDIVGRGAIQHAEFAMGSGEMSSTEFVDFLTGAFKNAASASRSGAVHFCCIDWRHVVELIKAGEAAYGAFLNLVTWVKTNVGQGSFYKSQHELIGVFRVGETPHLNNIELGRHGRTRSNVWTYSGANSFGASRLDDLKSHPTVKPIALVADAMKDCSRRGDVVLDTFCGSGTTILAAERVGRRGFAVEIEPRFVDVAIRRWQAFTKKDALLSSSGQTFDEIAAGHTGTPEHQSVVLEEI